MCIAIVILNSNGIYSYFTDKKAINDSFKVEAHTITYNYYVVSCSGSIVQMERTETQRGYTGTTIVLGADEAHIISNYNNTYNKMDFKIAGTKYEKNTEYIMPATDVTIEEYYYLTKYSVTFDTNSLVDPIPAREISEGDTYGELPELSKTGYTFYGWYKESTFENQVTSSTVFTELTDITLYAKYIPNTYQIVYDANNGTGEMATTPATYDQQAQLTANTFTRAGYTFAGWNTARDGSGTSYADEASVTNLTSQANGTTTLYAQWTPNTYIISFNANTGTGTMQNQPATYDVQTTLTTNTFTKTGYTFAGWSTTQNGSVEYNDGESVSNLVSTNNGNIELFAVWTPNTNTEYTVAHFLMNTRGTYSLSDVVIETRTGTSDDEIELNRLIKTSPTYNVPNGIYYSKMMLGQKNGNNGESASSVEVTGDIQTAKTTISPDGNLIIGIYYARTYGYLTTVAGANVTSVTTQSSEQYYYGQTVPQLTATMAYEAGYIKTFDKWESNNSTALADIPDNPIVNFTWPAMIEGTGITLTATKEVSTDTPYTVNYYLENANDSNYTLYTTKQLHGTTNDVITQQDVETSIANTTLYSTDLSTDQLNPTVITADGSTVVNVYYNRNTFTLTANGNANIAEMEVSTISTPNVDNTQPISIIETYKWGATIDLKATMPTETGYTYSFLGWDTVSTANLGTNYNQSVRSTTITMPAENFTITATANKTPNAYTVVFNSNGGTGTMAKQDFTYDIAQNLTANSFTKTGYTFKGWATVVVGINPIVTFTDEQLVSNLTTTPNGTVNLYAIWVDETAPVLSLTTDTTTKSIQVTVAPTETGSGMAGTYKYYIGTMQTVEVEGIPTEQVVYGSPVEKEGMSHTFTNLNSNTEYYIKVEALDNAGNLGTTTQAISTDQLTGEVTFANGYWSNGKYVVTANTTARDESNNLYSMQYQVITAESAIGGTTFNENANWEAQIITSGTRLGLGTVEQNGATNLDNLVLKEGDTVYARVYDGINGGPYYSYTITNPAVKTYTEETMAAVPYGSSTYNILAYETSATGFEVDIEKQISGVETYNYYAKSNDEDTYKLISTSTNWNDLADVSNTWLQMIGKDTLETNQTYKVKVLTRSSNGAVTQCLNTATMITQPKAEVNTTYAQNRTYIDSENYTAVIPAGFKVSSQDGTGANETDETTISSGMVLIDSSGNEFVWVPVNKAITYSTSSAIVPTTASNGNTYYKPMAIKQTSNTNNYESIVYTYSVANGATKSYRNTEATTGVQKSDYREPSLVTGTEEYTWAAKSGTIYDAASQYFHDILGFATYAVFGQRMNEEYTNMVKSVDEYGGFYIGRFETTLTNNDSGVQGVVGSKLGEASMNSLGKNNLYPERAGRWYGQYYYQDSKPNSINPYHTSTTVISSMILGSQYDAMLNRIIQGEDSSRIGKITGNHSGFVAKTGSWGIDVMNNIFELV